MKICICVNGRAHEGGVTSYINSVCDGLRFLNSQIDVMTLFGISQYRETKNSIVEKTDKLLLGSPIKTIILYFFSKIIIGLRLVFYYPIKRWNIIFAQDTSIVGASRLLRFLFKIPLILVVHGSVVLALVHQKKIKKNGFIWKLMINEEKKAYRKAKSIIANSDHTKNHILSLCPEIKNIAVVRNLVNENIFYNDTKAKKDGREKFKISTDTFVVFFSGRLTELKGPIYLLKSFEKIANDKKIILIYAGDGPEKINLEKYIQEKKLNKQVKILGNIPYEHIGKIYNIADLLVVPSITIGEVQEPLGIVALEGMAIGIPVIAFSVGGLKEIIKDGYNGILIPEKDINKLAQSILKIKKNPALTQKLIQNGKKEIKKEYTTRVVAQRLINIFQKILSK
ncbi:glycosyltransferase family 4 protein [Patescibacteria group bacterium]|nr:glycosyltransferase family 4 protein [Patescibacteria group bacterium]